MRRLLVMLALVLAVVPARAGAEPGSPWSPGPNAQGDDTYAGALDSPSSGTAFTASARILIQGWVVDRTASGWTGIDDVQVYLGPMDQSGTLLVDASLGVARPDVAAALGNPFAANAGFAAAFPANNLPQGPSTLLVYLHTPDKGWWYRSLSVTIQAAPTLAYSDDPVLNVQTPQPNEVLAVAKDDYLLSGFAVDRNAPPLAGVGGSGVRAVQVYLDGPRGGGTFLGQADLGHKSRGATGYGDRFGTAGWQLTIHPNHLSVDVHELFVYAASAVTANESLTVVSFSVS